MILQPPQHLRGVCWRRASDPGVASRPRAAGGICGGYGRRRGAVAGATWVVDDCGGADFTSIQAVDAASERAMVEIRAMA